MGRKPHTFPKTNKNMKRYVIHFKDGWSASFVEGTPQEAIKYVAENYNINDCSRLEYVPKRDKGITIKFY